MPISSFERFRRSILSRSQSRDLPSRLSEMGEFRRATRGHEIVLDSRTDQLVFLADGATKLVVQMPDGSEQVLAFHFTGDMVHVPHRPGDRLQLVALDDCRAITFPTNAFLDAAEGEPEVLRTILTRALLALQRSRNKAIRLGRKAAQERIADFLLAMAERIGIPDGTDIRIDLPMSRRDIGNSLGLTIETVSRQFTELRDSHMIATSGRSLVWLHDLEGLAVRAGQVAAQNVDPENCATSNKDLASPTMVG